MVNEQMNKKRQFVQVNYTVAEKFIVPRGIDLTNDEQVCHYRVRYNKLYIHLKNGDEIEVESEGWVESFDYKYPVMNEDPSIDYTDDDSDMEEDEEEEWDDIESRKLITIRHIAKKKLPPPKLKLTLKQK